MKCKTLNHGTRGRCNLHKRVSWVRARHITRGRWVPTNTISFCVVGSNAASKISRLYSRHVLQRRWTLRIMQVRSRFTTSRLSLPVGLRWIHHIMWPHHLGFRRWSRQWLSWQQTVAICGRPARRTWNWRYHCGVKVDVKLRLKHCFNLSCFLIQQLSIVPTNRNISQKGEIFLKCPESFWAMGRIF